jgi:flagellar biogenesis protein FliO
MDFLDFVRAALALAVTLGLIGLASVGMRKYAPGLIGRLQAAKGQVKRLQVVETLVLGPTQRLLLVRVGDKERLILLGEGRELSSLPDSNTKTSG